MHRMTLTPYGPDAWLLRFAEQPGEAAYEAARAICRSLEAEPPPGLIEYVPGYTSVLLEFAAGTAPAGSPELKALPARLAKQLKQPAEPGPIREIPVVYDGPDLARVAEHAGLSAREVCELHAATLYRVALLGFAPGFPYLEGLDPKLHTPRLDTPRPKVDAGSVAIGGSHTGIYSVPGPGGWNLIGRTEIRLFDPVRACPGHEAEMCWLRMGDRVRFVPRGKG
ncbi:MAG: 5-oxoprolinase subunit PxpB [Betaproteobacteria bacterium]|nr:5-oxoprolinase subunit PxpB [Betaproteobacteria bacterium]